MSVSEKPFDDAAAAFLENAGWQDAKARPLAGDASTRRYVRLARNGKSALLMIAPPAAESPACPPEASETERKALGYNALTRLAGPNLNAFTAIADALRSAGLSAPEVYAADADRGYALIEDLGDDLFARIADGANETALYEAAVDALLHLRAHPPARPESDAYRMLDYDRTAMGAEAALLAQWYWPLKTGAAPSDDLQSEYAAIIDALTARLSHPHAVVLRDFHAENLLWLPRREGFRRVGVIDFQDGLFGHLAYDLVSLLEDARRDVAPELAGAMIERYCAGAAAAGDFGREAFLSDYAILAAQRNAKILGIFARLARRDGKRRYLEFMPRVEALFRRDLAREPLNPLRTFIAAHLPELAP